MRNTSALTVTSLLSILLFALEQTNDIVRGFEPGGFAACKAILIMVVWLYGTLMLTGRRAGYVIMLLGALLGSVVPAAHMRGAGMVGGRVAGTDGVFFLVLTLMALGVTAVFSLVLSVQGLWSLRKRGPAPL